MLMEGGELIFGSSDKISGVWTKSLGFRQNLWVFGQNLWVFGQNLPPPSLMARKMSLAIIYRVSGLPHLNTVIMLLTH